MSDTDLERIRKALDRFVRSKPFQGNAASLGDSPPSLLHTPSKPAAQPKYRPWDRSDLFHRLRTFRSSTWYCKPECISALECARRGWTNGQADRLHCEACTARISFRLKATSKNDAAGAYLTHAEVVQEAHRFVQQLQTGHDEACPWRKDACDAGLAVFPALLPDDVKTGFDQRVESLTVLSCLPPLKESAMESLCKQRRTRLATLLDKGPSAEQTVLLPLTNGQASGAAIASTSSLALQLQGGSTLCGGLAGHGSAALLERARLLAVCGWTAGTLRASAQGSPSVAALPHSRPSEHARGCVLSCALCGAREGLWLYIPADADPRKALPAPPTPQPAQRIQLAGVNIAGGPMQPSTQHSAASPQSAASALSPSAHIETSTPARDSPAKPFGSDTPVAPAFGKPSAQAVLTAPPESAAAPEKVLSGPFGAAVPTDAVFGRPVMDDSHSQLLPRCALEQPDLAGGAVGRLKQHPAHGTHNHLSSEDDLQSAAGPFGSSWAGSEVFGLKALAATASLPSKSPSQPPIARAGSILSAKASGKRKRSADAGLDEQASTPTTAKRVRNASESIAEAEPAESGLETILVPPFERHAVLELQPLDPLLLHRPFCPWRQEGPAPERRCGWRWCLDSLVPLPGLEEEASFDNKHAGRELVVDAGKFRKPCSAPTSADQS